MKKYTGIEELWKEIEKHSRGGWRINRIDRYHIQLLRRNREAIMYAMPILLLIEIGLSKKAAYSDYLPPLKEVMAECEAIIGSGDIFMSNNVADRELSMVLERKVEMSDRAVARAGNLCNNLPLGILSGEMHEIVLRARDICREAISGMRFHI